MAASRLRRLCEWMLRWRYPAVPIAVGLVLALPSLGVGLLGDDLTHRAVVRNQGLAVGVRTSPWHPFRFLDGDPARNGKLMDLGWLPWWSDPRCKAAFLRPATALTHILDYRGWPDWPWLMHAQSLVWYAAVVWGAATLYRRLMGRALPAWAAVLAALLFTVDEAHTWPVCWLANRNAIVAAAFGLWALVAHDRWRRDGWRWGAVLTPLLLALALLGKELAVCVGAYLLAYALFLDRGPWRSRLLSLLPCLLVGVAWLIAYRAMGFGLSRGAVYVGPVDDPVRFGEHVVRHAPLLLLGQWGLPASELALFLSSSAAWVHWAWAVAYVGLVAVLLVPLVARDALARFWALGMVLSLLPASAPFPHDRLLMFVGLGAMGLLAQWLVGRRDRAGWVPSSQAWRRLARVFAVLFVAIHLVVAPVLWLPACAGMPWLRDALLHQLDTLPRDPAFGRQTAVFVNSLSALVDVLWVQQRVMTGEPLPARSLRLCPSCTPATIRRLDARSIAVRPEGGYLLPAGRWHRPGPRPAASLVYAVRYMDRLFHRDDERLPLGHTVELSAATIEITALTPDGRPAEATFRFPVPLDDPSLRWLVQTAKGYQAFTPPALGGTVAVPSPLE